MKADGERIETIAKTAETEKRDFTPEEKKELDTIEQRDRVLEVKLKGIKREQEASDITSRADNRMAALKLLRENARNGKKSEIVFTRDLMTVSDVEGGGVIPVKIQDILDPLTEGFILDKVGLPMPTGLAGDYVWPEGVALTDTKISFSKLTARPERIGIAIPVTNQSLNQSDGILDTIVRTIMPKSVQLLLNKILFSPVKVTGATNLVGPFVGKVASAVNLGATPSFAALNGMKAQVLASGVEGSGLCWVMSKAMAAILEGEPINAKGIYRPMIENDILCGLPVYTSNCIKNGSTEYIGLGDWRYQPMGLFNTVRFIVDPYSQARKDSVDFVLNVDYGTVTLRPEAFVLGGGTSRAGDYLLERVRHSFQTYAFPPSRNAEFYLAELGNDAGIYGAVKMLL